ncbi:hypothetical protein BDZ97DRAFT_1829679 [Flammula alnicola]|nr:hypothetical protein BDZ97DRAFT_1829679 [Flammula alnicola]
MYSKAFFYLVFTAYSIVSVHARVCTDKNVTESTPLTLPSGDVITMERFTCSDTALTRRQPSSATDRRHSRAFDLNKRAASECTMPNCMCGVPCFFKGCRPVTQAIQATHCTQLATQLMNTQGAFTIPANEGIGFILQSCEYTAFGSETEATQYCFDDMGVAALELFDVCGATQQGDCGGNSQGTAFFVDQISL